MIEVRSRSNKLEAYEKLEPLWFPCEIDILTCTTVVFSYIVYTNGEINVSRLMGQYLAKKGIFM